MVFICFSTKVSIPGYNVNFCNYSHLNYKEKEIFSGMFFPNMIKFN